MIKRYCKNMMKYGMKLKINLEKNLVVNYISNISLYSNKMPKENKSYAFLTVMLLDSIIIISRRIQIRSKKQKNGAYNIEELELDECDSESDYKFNKYQNIIGGSH